ncbi:MAG TPA: hypothetical protein VF718_03225 [Allosphingosinicella sp.]|jgi:hypothetical protein
MSAQPYLVASRQGLYAVRRDGWRRLVEGRFFGIVCRGEQVFAFRHGAPGREADSGCVVRFEWRSGELRQGDIVVEGLDHNCHQLDFFDHAFFVVDTLNQRILEYDESWRPVAAHQILPAAERGGPGHGHLNSIAGSAEAVFVMLHNEARGRPSEIVLLDRAFRERGRTTLPCSGCHDIVALEDGSLLTCLSPRGEIGVAGGEAVAIDNCWTRGLVVGPEEIVVGSSLFGKRMGRALLPGFVTFLDRGYRRTARLYLPAAPTQIRAVGFDPFGSNWDAAGAA